MNIYPEILGEEQSIAEQELDIFARKQCQKKVYFIKNVKINSFLN